MDDEYIIFSCKVENLQTDYYGNKITENYK